MDVILYIIIAIIVVGVGLAVARFAITKWFPTFMEYFKVIVWVVMAALFIYILLLLWPLLTGVFPPRHY